MIGLFALGSSILHLGRPQYAFRAVLGLKTSWLSREILSFGLFAGTASFADVRKARAALGYSPGTDFREGVRAFLRWFSNR